MSEDSTEVLLESGPFKLEAACKTVLLDFGDSYYRYSSSQFSSVEIDDPSTSSHTSGQSGYSYQYDADYGTYTSPTSDYTYGQGSYSYYYDSSSQGSHKVVQNVVSEMKSKCVRGRMIIMSPSSRRCNVLNGELSII